jgi:outer membrane protein OmpA-like peptidoglycan-associated protein
MPRRSRVSIASAVILILTAFPHDLASAQMAEAQAAQFGYREAMEDALWSRQHYDLYGLRFASGKATIGPDPQALLDDIVKALNNAPDWRLRIVGHTDSTGDAAHNDTLSLQRANALKAALVERGVDALRLETAGAGESQPVANNDTAEGRALNRRVELVRLDGSAEVLKAATSAEETATTRPAPATAAPAQAPASTDAARAAQLPDAASQAAGAPAAQAAATATTRTQAPAAQGPATSAETAGATTAALPATAAPARGAEGQSQVAAAPQQGPANLCQELLAFIKAPPPEAAPPAAAPGAQGTAQRQASTQQGGATGGTTPPQAPAQGASAQQTTGQSGPAVEAPRSNTAPATQGSGQNAPQTAGIAAPVPAAPTSPPKESILSLAEAEELANANDMKACREAGRRLRLAGVAVPPPLLALTALDLRFHQQAQQTQSAQGGSQPTPPQ